MNSRFRSLQAQLVLRLAAGFVVATLLAVSAIVYEGSQAAQSLGDDELERRAVQIAHFVERGPDGELHLTLPARLDQLYQSPARTRLLAVRSGDGAMIAASAPEFAAEVDRWPPVDGNRHPFRLDDFGPTSQDYNGLTVRVDSIAGPLSVTVAAVSDAEALAEGLVKRFIRDLAWAVPLFAAAMLAIAAWSIRRSLRPVHAASERAAAIGPVASAVRLPVDDLPTELVPLVAAVNRAFDRMEQGFAVQRQFTANAAHELRTPLAILTAALDELKGGEELEKLRGDAARMNRLVGQLLSVARLDSVPMDVTAQVDLVATTVGVLEYMTPWALGQVCLLGFDAPLRPVRVLGNADAIADAVRNLVENAVHQSPAGGEVAVTVSPEGTVSVADRGPGVPEADRQRIFERFWRGRGITRQGAGLGLAIVAEIAKAHGGSIDVADRPGGGALFALRIPLA
jgi:two-component system, OmpR family, sensor histidine kinase TctE